jgi:hypothetical protein
LEVVGEVFRVILVGFEVFLRVELLYNEIEDILGQMRVLVLGVQILEQLQELLLV